MAGSLADIESRRKYVRGHGIQIMAWRRGMRIGEIQKVAVSESLGARGVFVISHSGLYGPRVGRLGSQYKFSSCSSVGGWTEMA